MALGSHLITVRRLEKYINDVIGKKANLPDTSKTIIGNISQINSDLTNNTCVNLLNPTAQTQTINGVTFTNNGDGTYTVNGTASVVTTLRVGNVKAKVGQWLVGCPQGGSETKYQVGLLPDGTWEGWATQRDNGEGSLIQNVGDSETLDTVVIVIYKGYTANNLLFKPMLTTDLNAKYDDYVPYTGGSGRLNEDVSNKQDKTDNTLTTTDKTVVGAINELKNSLITNMKYIDSNVNNIAPQGFTQVRLLHGLNTSKITGITPYFNGNAMGGVTNCRLDGNYVEMNISNYSSNQTISGVAGAIIYYHN